MITAIDVTEFENKVTAAFSMHIIRDKEKIPIAKEFAKAVEIFSNISAEDFLNNYTQTLWCFIFPAKNWDSFAHQDRMATIVHECVHGRQFKKDWGMATKYTFNKHMRAVYEAEAKSAAMLFNCYVEKPSDINTWSGKYIPEAAERLRPYGLEQDDIDYVIAKMTSDILTYKHSGNLIYEETRVACKIYDKLNND